MTTGQAKGSDDRLALGPRQDELVDIVAAHEHITPCIALEKVAVLLHENWGPPAVRQMIRDEIDDAAAASRWPDVDGLLDTYQWCCRNLPYGNDRRQRRLQ
jgi:hypothetical protein